MKAIVLSAVAALMAGPYSHAAEPPRSLFNGKDFTGWESYLGPPHASVMGLDLKKDAQGNYTEPVGLNKDPKKVFSITELDGTPVIRISGEIWGGISTLEEFENYHLKMEVKWGEKRWPPREKLVRDSGLMYHCVGEQGADYRCWLRSFEYQIMEDAFGDFFNADDTIVDVEADQPEKGPLVYRHGAPLRKANEARVRCNPIADKHHGWNVVELYAVGDRAVHVCNGKTNMVVTNLRQPVPKKGGKIIPLTKGRIQLQSEGAEVFYRNITIRPIDKIPAEVLPK